MCQVRGGVVLWRIQYRRHPGLGGWIGRLVFRGKGLGLGRKGVMGRGCRILPRGGGSVVRAEMGEWKRGIDQKNGEHLNTGEILQIVPNRVR